MAEKKEHKYYGFKKLLNKLKQNKDLENPEALAAEIGRKKYGKKKFQKAAAKGKTLRGAKPKSY